MTGNLFPPNNPGHPVLDLGHGNAGGREALIVSDSNRQAVDWIERWPDWPVNAAALAGGTGCGKTHLAEIWRDRSDAVAITAPDLLHFDIAAYLATPAHIVIDDAQPGSGGAAWETAFFHLFNAVREAAQSLLIVGWTPPARWAIGLPDLKSRLSALPCITIAPPDDAMLAALFGKLFADRQVMVSEDVLAYLVPRIERSCQTVHALVERLDRLALARHSAITIPLVKSVLDAEVNPPLL